MGMIELPNSWDQLESEYYRHFDPYDLEEDEEIFCDMCDASKLDLCICETTDN